MSEVWQPERLGKICYIKARIGWRGLSSAEYTEDGPFLIAGQHIKNGMIAWDKCDHISEQRFLESHEIILRSGDVIITKDGTIGRVARVDELPGDATINGTMMLVRPLRRLVYRFLYHVLNGRGFQKLIDDKVSGSSIPHLFQRDMVELEVALPPMEKQAKIAEVLDTLDAAIRGTQAVVVKLRAMKQGLLHDLLTRGIDANGELRPPQPEAPHLYHQTPLGWLPKEWEVDHLSCFASIHGGKRLPAGHSYADRTTGFKYLRVTDFFGKGFKTNDLENLEEATFRALERYEIKAGQLYISIAGSLGNVGVFPESDDGETRTILTENAARIVLNRAGSPRFLSMMMNSVPIQQQVEWEKGTGGGVPKLALFRIAQFYIGFPQPSEQDAVTAAFDELCHRETVEQALLDKLRLQKSGLMDDLLTGRVPVTPLL